MAVYSGQAIDLSFTADVDLSGSQYRFVAAASTAGKVGGPTAGASALGVLQNTPKAGDEAVVRVHGTSKVELASLSAASYGGLIKTASNGQGEGYQSMTACTVALGQSLAEPSATASGIMAEVLLFTPGYRG